MPSTYDMMTDCNERYLLITYSLVDGGTNRLTRRRFSNALRVKSRGKEREQKKKEEGEVERGLLIF